MHAADANPPLAFRGALTALRALTPRAEIELNEAPAPQRLAPYAIAMTADVVLTAADGEEDEVASGRLVLLHDPDGQDAWDGQWRMVVFAKTGMDREMERDDMANGVGWSWLQDALADSAAQFTALGGTVTTTFSEPFGTMDSRGASGELEIRASWTPLDDEVAPHAVAWLHLLEQMAGLEPIPPGVAALRR